MSVNGEGALIAVVAGQSAGGCGEGQKSWSFFLYVTR